VTGIASLNGRPPRDFPQWWLDSSEVQPALDMSSSEQIAPGGEFHNSLQLRSGMEICMLTGMMEWTSIMALIGALFL
jgi:hypothetical protein